MRAQPGPALSRDPGHSGRASGAGQPAPARPGWLATRLLVATGAVVAAAALGAYLAAIAAHPMTVTLKGFDLLVYLDGARQALHHPGGLYTWVYQGHPGIQFTYPPFAALLFAAGLALPFAVLMAGAAAISVLALGATVAIAFRELGWRGARRLGATLLVAGVALWTEPVQRALFLGQVEIVLMALVTWDLCQPDGRRWKGAATGLAAGVKLVPLLFIVYLLLTRRFRQAAVATAAFAVTVGAGFAALPSASVTWWLHGDFLRAGRTGFVGGQQNQSLRGLLTRLAGSVDGAALPWLVLAVAVAVAGLGAAVALDRAGYRFAGLMTCALTAVLVSPISWDHHWVWIAPGLAVLADAGARAARPRTDGKRSPGTAVTGSSVTHWRAGACLRSGGWLGLGLVTAVAFGAWPDFWLPRAGLLEGGLIDYAPGTAWASGDNPAYREYHWHGLQLAAGNLEVGCGLVLLAVAVAAAALVALRSAGRTRFPRGTRPAAGAAAGSAPRTRP